MKAKRTETEENKVNDNNKNGVNTNRGKNRRWVTEEYVLKEKKGNNFNNTKCKYMYILSFFQNNRYKLRFIIKIEEKIDTTPFDRKLLFIAKKRPQVRVVTFLGWFPFAIVLCSVCCKVARQFLTAEIRNLEISDEIFHVLDFLCMESCTVLYYMYDYYCNPKYIFF